MDVKMPVMDGYETTKIIRQNEKENNVTHPIRIIAITANNQPEEIEYCKSIGMNDFMAKPFTTDQAKDAIDAVCENVL
jgi:CheY-like chemotaxis protein